MTQRSHGWVLRISSLGCLAALWLAGGCAPRQFGLAIAYRAEKAAVTDAAARHTDASPYYRFNTSLLSDLDDALECADVRTQRKMAAAVFRQANALSQASSASEIERMPVRAREKLERLGLSRCVFDSFPEARTCICAALREPAQSRHAKDDVAVAATAGASARTVALQRHFWTLAEAALESDLRDVDRLPPLELRRKLRDMRKGVEDLPDDKGRTQRRVLYSWAAFLTAAGIAREESHLAERCIAKAEKTFDRIALWRPAKPYRTALIARYAPIIGVEWPADRRYDANFDRIGAVDLSADGEQIEVNIDPAEATLYAYTSKATIGGRAYRQLSYVWWFPERPEMTTDDPAAGHIDGSMLRITLDANDEPMFVESSLNCGCAHEVFVSDRIESAARDVFGAPLAGKRFAVEKSVPGKHDVVVIHAFTAGPNAAHPLVLSAAGYHEVCRIKFDASASLQSMDIVEDRVYGILDYDTLDRLPFRDGVASMFGPDGLVHYAGRREGLLLAPSGILSAGQPRKRGTQRIRWDSYLHDDPHLLEKTLRIPPLD